MEVTQQRKMAKAKDAYICYTPAPERAKAGMDLSQVSLEGLAWHLGDALKKSCAGSSYHVQLVLELLDEARRRVPADTVARAKTAR